MLHATNPYVKKFEQVRDFTVDSPEVEVMLRINSDLNRTGLEFCENQLLKTKFNQKKKRNFTKT